MDRTTVGVYEREAARYRERRATIDVARVEEFAAACLPGWPVADLGCGPGLYLPCLPQPVAGIDAAEAMLRLARDGQPGAALIRADLEALPFGGRSLGGAWARHSYLHVERDHLPLALARLQWALRPGAPLMLSVSQGEHDGPEAEDDLPGRLFRRWRDEQLADVLLGAGFEQAAIERSGSGAGALAGGMLYARATRARTLPDTVAPGMRLLVCGLNPSVVAADAGFGFAGATNRFWPAALEAGVVSAARDPLRALGVDGVGMTDLVKRATPRASEVAPGEYRAGAGRLARLVGWLRPRAVCFVGLEGWRVAVDRRARPGWQPAGFAGAAAYVMPSTSGLNAATSRAELVDHLRSALAGPAPGNPPGETASQARSSSRSKAAPTIVDSSMPKCS